MREEIHVLVDLVDLYRSLPEENDYRDLDLATPFPENAHTVEDLGHKGCTALSTLENLDKEVKHATERERESLCVLVLLAGWRSTLPS